MANDGWMWFFASWNIVWRVFVDVYSHFYPFSLRYLEAVFDDSENLDENMFETEIEKMILHGRKLDRWNTCSTRFERVGKILEGSFPSILWPIFINQPSFVNHIPTLLMVKTHCSWVPDVEDKFTGNAPSSCKKNRWVLGWVYSKPSIGESPGSHWVREAATEGESTCKGWKWQGSSKFCV